MQKHTIRTIIIWVSIVLSIIWIYPTIGWMLIKDDARQARLHAWSEEDKVYESNNVFKDMWHATKRWAEFDRTKVINLGLDLQGGIHMVIGLDTSAINWDDLAKRYENEKLSRPDIIKRLQDTALQTVRRRVAEFEAQEPLIQALGTDQIQIELPGEKDIKRAQNLIMRTAFLTFHIVAGPDETKVVYQKIMDKFPDRFKPFLKLERGQLVVPKDNIEQVRQVVKEASEIPGLIPEGKQILFSGPPNRQDPQQYEIYLVGKEAAMTGEGLKSAAARPNDRSTSGAWRILFNWNADAAATSAKVTAENLKKGMAIVLDNVVVSAPTIQAVIRDSGEITGNFTREQAQDVAIALNSGSMPVPVKEESSVIVGATLGSDSVRSGVISGVAGLILVLLFTGVYYRSNGIIANIGLVLNALMLLALMAYLHATLTLPGIAGLILTIGMAVDANVLVFERMREERRNGRSVLATIDSGYTRASATVIDSNATTLIAGLVLMQFGTGPVQGFAVTLCIGIVTSVYTALTVTRAMYDWLTKRNLFKEIRMYSMIPPDTKIPFMQQRFIAFAFSIALIAVGFIAFTYREIAGPTNFGVDFTTGTNVIVRLDSPGTVSVLQVRGALDSAKLPESSIQEYIDSSGTPNRFLVHVGSIEEPVAATPEAKTGDAAAETTSTRVVNSVTSSLASIVGGDSTKVLVESVQSVGPAVGKRLIIDAILAVFLSMFFQVIYLWFRFDLKFSMGAVLALFHDVLITMGLFALTGRQISMGAVAAILTVVGYSINDTIVVFDRIREDTRLYRGRGMSLLDIMNMSINQTLSRTLLTSGATLLVVIALYLFGGEVLRDFAFILIVGIVFGTYSSVYVASAFAYYLNMVVERYKRRHAGETQAPSSRKRPRREKPGPQEGEATV